MSIFSRKEKEQEKEKEGEQAAGARAQTRAQRRHTYEILPVNFITLPEQRQDELASRFHFLLNSVPSPVRIAMVRGKRGVELGPDRTAVVEYPTFFIECGEPLDDILEANRFLFQRADSFPVPDVRTARWSHLVLEDGRLAQCLTVYELPAALPIGFLSELYGTADVVQFTASPLDPEEAARKIENYKRTVNALVSAAVSKRRSPSQALLNKRNMAERALAAVTMGSSRLFKVSTTFAVTGSSVNELRDKVRQLRNRLNARLIRVDSPKMVQGRLYEGRGKVLYVDTNTLGAFYPFVAGEVLESGGIFLGINALSGAPVVYNPLVRPNVNISIIGTSGAGKSFTSKIFLNRLLGRDPEIPFYVIDPEGEYTPLVEWLGGQAVHVKNYEGTGLGLDPLALFEKGEAADTVCDIAGLTERKDVSRVRDLVMSSQSLEELYGRLPADLAEKFSSMKGGPESFIFQGQPLSFTPKMSFDMRRIESKLVKQLVSLLIFGKIWQIVSKPDAFGITRATPRMVLVDEAWLFMAIPSAATFLEKAARLGRKRNCILLINTQRPADMIGDVRAGASLTATAAAGRTILENSATKILMKQDEANRRIVGEAFGLSEQEMDAVVDLPQGEGILITETTHARVQFVAPTQEEYQLFTTKPSDLE